jgi:ferric-dicitrate binding protein FerR (iron transport regulator)
MNQEQASYENLILRFIQGSATEEEARELEHWINEDPERLQTFRQLADSWSRAELADPAARQRQQLAWKRLKAEMEQAPAAGTRPTGTRPTRKVRIPGYLRIAATILVAAGFTWFASYKYYKPNRQQGQMIEVSTPFGSRTHIVLPDSSEAWLNAGTTIRYNADLFQRKRELYLEGEAFFRVKPDRKRMFLVATSDISVRVYGTSFNIKSFPEEGSIETTLIEGRISLARNSAMPLRKQKQVYLEPNQKATFIKKEGHIALAEIMDAEPGQNSRTLKPGNILVYDEVDSEQITSWTKGQLVIESEPLVDLSKKLARKYDIRFVFKDEAAKKIKFSGIIEDESLEQVMYAMQLASPITYKIEGKIVFLDTLAN